MILNTRSFYEEHKRSRAFASSKGSMAVSDSVKPLPVSEFIVNAAKQLLLEKQ